MDCNLNSCTKSQKYLYTMAYLDHSDGENLLAGANLHTKEVLFVFFVLSTAFLTGKGNFFLLLVDCFISPDCSFAVVQKIYEPMEIA